MILTKELLLELYQRVEEYSKVKFNKILDKIEIDSDGYLFAVYSDCCYGYCDEHNEEVILEELNNLDTEYLKKQRKNRLEQERLEGIRKAQEYIENERKRRYDTYLALKKEFDNESEFDEILP